MELVYATLEAHLNSLVNSGELFNYSIIQLGNPQSTGIVRCHKIIGGNVYTTLHIYKVVNDEYVVTDLSKYYYYIDGKIIAMSSELDPNVYTYYSLSPDQIEFYLANPNLSAQEILNMTPNPIPELSELQLIKKSELDSECQAEILIEYPIYKQLNITNQNGYTENDLFTMNLYIAERRSKLSLLNGMVDATSSDLELDNISWSILFHLLVDTIIGMEIGSSLDVAKLKKLNELKVWNKELTDSGYLDPVTSITLAAKESDITAFTKDLTGLSSILKEAETNVDIDIPAVWPFIDINNSFITSLTPVEYISLLNRYFVSVRNNIFINASYLYQIYTASNVGIINEIILL